MSKKTSFISTQDEEAIVAAIQEAEKNTSGEIRVHIEAHTDDHITRDRSEERRVI